MRWLIAEDALKDRKGHWFEYVDGFARELPGLGDEVTVLGDRSAEPFLAEHLKIHAVLPPSIWHRMGDGAGAMRRYLRVPIHAWNTWRTIGNYLSTNNRFDIIFVPTVLVHHLLGWAWLVKRSKLPCPVLLFFPNLPISLGPDDTPSWVPSPTTRLLARLFAWLRPEILAGAVILGVETQAMRNALSNLTGLPVKYFPHPVSPLQQPDIGKKDSEDICMACYGPARQEKGSEILLKSVGQYLRRFPESRARFIFQWIDDFRADNGELIRLDQSLLNDNRVEVVRRYFKDGEYARYLARTDVLLLPYRRASYGLRVSRVAIEAITLGLPIVATRRTTLAQQTEEFGACLQCDDGNAESLVIAIEKMLFEYGEMRAEAQRWRQIAQHHFSVRAFRDYLCNALSGGSDARAKNAQALAYGS
jgi:glycosyltransferase involved in cell wall biosynthesis